MAKVRGNTVNISVALDKQTYDILQENKHLMNVSSICRKAIIKAVEDLELFAKWKEEREKEKVQGLR